MNKAPYSIIRKDIKVGDVIGCRGGGLISKIIRKLKGGEWDWSHVAIIIRDAHNEATGRVEVLEALSKGGMQRNYLSEVYAKDHGRLFWLPLCCNDKQKKKIMELAVKIVEAKIKYDFKTTWLAVLLPIFVDGKKFNCSEAVWYLLTRAGRLLHRFNEKSAEIAPVPGNVPTWAGIEPIEIEIKK